MRTKGVTMQDVAKAAGVSQSTVSMILNQKSSSFPTTTIEKVLAAATALNYQFRRTAPPLEQYGARHRRADHEPVLQRHDPGHRPRGHHPEHFDHHRMFLPQSRA